MAIDFKRIPKDGEDFELLCAEVLRLHGATIVSMPSRGPDQKKDLLISVTTEDNLGTKEEIKYLVQCKHKAHSGRSVLESDIGDFRSAVHQHKADGYFLITSSLPSSTVQTNLEATHAAGELKTKIWNKSELAAKIEECAADSGILERYNLKEGLEILFSQMRAILLGPHHLPFLLCKEINKSNFKGLIFEQRKEDQNFNPISEYIGYFCFDTEVERELRNELISENGLHKLIIVSARTTNETEQTISIETLYSEIQNYRDAFYQEKICLAFSFSPINPTAIRLLETCLRDMPYKPQDVTINTLIGIINLTPYSSNYTLIAEAARTAAHLQIESAAEAIMEQLLDCDSLGLKDIERCIFIEVLVSSLGKLDNDALVFREKMFELFEDLKDVNIKALLLNYFIQNKIKDSRDLLKNFFAENREVLLQPQNHAIAFNNQRIYPVQNKARLKISYIEQQYLKSINTE